MAKTQEELNTLKTEYETLNNKLKELTDDELKIVTGGNIGDKGTTYYLETDGRGVWIENETIVTSITVSGRAPRLGEKITYTDINNNKRIVIATPNEGYFYQGCTFNSTIYTYKATFTI